MVEMTEAEKRCLLYEKKGPIAYITFNTPETLNALNPLTWKLGADAVYDYVADGRLKCLIISGAGGNFSSGGDIKWEVERRSDDPKWKAILQPSEPGRRYRLYYALERCQKQVIAAIDGYCIASALVCAILYCDIHICSERAKFGATQSKWGFVTAANPQYQMPILRHMSIGNALYLLLTGETIDAETALRMGLVSEVVPHEKLMKRATELATAISEMPPGACVCYKNLVYTLAEIGGYYSLRLQDTLGQLAPTPQKYEEEGSRAFLEKHKPDWTKVK